MSTALERLRLLGSAGTWVKVGRFEVNTATGDRRPIPGLELGPLAEDVQPESSPWGLGTLASDLGQATADIPGNLVRGAHYLETLPRAAMRAINPWSTDDAEEKEKAELDALLFPYERSKEGIAPPIPSFTDDPLQATLRGAARSLPETVGIALSGGTGQLYSSANQGRIAHDEMLGRGVPEYIALPASAAVGVAQGALDRIGAEGALKGLTGNFIGRMAKGAALEGLTETAQEGIGVLGESLTGKDQDYNLVKERLATALSGGLLMGGVMGAAPKIAGINKPAEVPIPVAHQEAAALEQKLFPSRTIADYVQIAQEKGPYKAMARRLNDLTLEMDPDIKWEMLLDDQTDLALGREWQKIKTRVDADPEAAIVDVDLDGVKAGNDTLGHDVADALIFKPSTDAIHAVAEKYGISRRLRIRKGGDEFRIVVPANVAERFAKDLQEAMPPRFIPLPSEAAATAGFPDGAYIQHGASIGWGSTSQEADQSMYRAKEVKPNRGAVSPGQPPFVSQVQAEEQVIQALAPSVSGPPVIAEARGGLELRYPAKSAEMVEWADRASRATEFYKRTNPKLAEELNARVVDAVQSYISSVKRGDEDPVVPWERVPISELPLLGAAVSPGVTQSRRVSRAVRRYGSRPAEVAEVATTPLNEGMDLLGSLTGTTYYNPKDVKTVELRRSPGDADEHLATILDRTAPYSRERDKRYLPFDPPDYLLPGSEWSSQGDKDSIKGALRALDPALSSHWEAVGRAHEEGMRELNPSGPGTPIDGLYGLKRNIQVVRGGDGLSQGGDLFSPEYPGVPISPWAEPPKVRPPLASPPPPRSPSTGKRTRATERRVAAEGAIAAEAEAALKRDAEEARAVLAAPDPKNEDQAADYLLELSVWLGEFQGRDEALAEAVANRVSEMRGRWPELSYLFDANSEDDFGLTPSSSASKAIRATTGGARSFLDKAVDIRQEYFTAEGNLPIPWMQAHERQVQTQRAAKLAVDFIVKDYGKALAQEVKNGVLPEEMNSRAKKYLSGDQSVQIPEQMKPVLDRMRAYYDKNISQALIDSKVARDPAHVKQILENQGEYIFRAFKMHTEPEWAKTMVGTPTFDKAVDYMISKEDAFLQRVVESRNSLAAEYDGRAKVLAWQEQKARELIAQREAILASGGRLQDEFVAGQARQADSARSEAGALAATDRESSLAQIGTRADAALAGAEASLQEDLAVLGEYESLFGAEAPGLGWAKSRLMAEHEEGRQGILRDERLQSRGANADFRSAGRMASAEHRDSTRQARQDADFGSMAMEADIRQAAGREMAGIFAESNMPNTQGSLDYGRKDLRSRIAAEREALRQRYAKKLGIAKGRATWAEKRQAANAANQNRRAEAAGKVEGMITFDPQPVHTGGFKGLSKSWLAKRKNIPQEYLDVMGVIDDPATGLVVVAERAARSIGRKEMWDDIVLGSLGRDIFDKPMPGHVHKIEGVTVPGPDGKDIELYTSKELHDAVTHAFDTAHQEAGFWDLFNGVLKANATVLSPQAMFRNFWSGFVPLVANGNLPDVFKHSAYAARVTAANAGWSNNAAWRQEAIDATRHGVLGTNVDTRDLAEYLRPIVEAPEQKGITKKGWENAQKLYAAGDNYAKLVAWKGERDRYAKAYDLPRDSDVVKARAAEVVKRTIQNYDRLPEWARQVRKSPVIGPFVSFPASVISNVGGIYQTAAEDIKSDNPKVRQAGIVRAASALGTLGGIAFAAPLANFFKDDDDEDERALEDVRELLPPWMKNSMLKLWDKGPGQVRVIDLSFLNYYDTVTRPIQMLVRGDLTEEPGEAMLAAAWESAKKIFGEELALSAYADLTRGPASGGPSVVNEEMQPGVALWRVGRYALKSLAPGAIRSAARIVEAEPGKRATEVGALFGPRITTINVPKSLDYSLYELQADRAAIRTSLQGALKSTALLAMPEFEANVSGFQPSTESIYSQALDKYQRSIRLGVSPQEAKASMGDKMYRPGKIMLSLLQLGATPEVAVQRAVEYEWRGLKPDLLVQVREKKKAALADYIQSHPGATQLSIERRRLELEDWGRQAISIINSQDQKPDPLEALRKFGAN